MNRKVITIPKDRQLACVWASAGKTELPLRCVWRIGRAAAANADASPDDGAAEGKRCA